MLYLNTRVYSLYWDITLLCLSRASVEQLTARSLRARTDHIYRFDLPPPRSTSDAKRSCPFPSSAIKTAVSSTSHLLFQHRFAIFVPRVRLSPKSRMSFCNFTELLAADSPDGIDTIVPFSQTAAGKYLLTTLFIEFAQDHRSATPPTTTAVNALLVTLDSQTFPFNASEEDAVGGERLKAHSRLATLLWRTLIASCPTNPIQPAAVPSPLKNEKLALAATIATQRIRLLAHSAAGASTGVYFFNECLELQTQRVLVQCTITIEAAICSIAALHSLSAVDADGNPLTLDQVVELTPPRSYGAGSHLQRLGRQRSRAQARIQVPLRQREASHPCSRHQRLPRAAGAGAPTALGPGRARLRPLSRRLKDYVPGSICPALKLVNKPVAVPQPPKVPAVETVSPTTGRNADRPARAAPKKNRVGRDNGEDYDTRPYKQRGYDNGKGPYRGGWPKDNRSRDYRD